MKNFVYPAKLARDPSDVGFVVTFRDLAEAITQGDTVPDALRQAADCLDEAISGRIRRKEDIPEPSTVRAKDYAVSLPAHTAAKAALYSALRKSKMTTQQLAKRLQCDEQEVCRMLDPRHGSKLQRIESALTVLGQELVIGVETAG